MAIKDNKYCTNKKTHQKRKLSNLMPILHSCHMLPLTNRLGKFDLRTMHLLCHYHNFPDINNSMYCMLHRSLLKYAFRDLAFGIPITRHLSGYLSAGASQKVPYQNAHTRSSRSESRENERSPMKAVTEWPEA